MKSFIFIILTSIWITGILAPPVLQLLDVNRPFVSINMNEEEPQEQNKKDQSEEIVLLNISSHQSVILFENRRRPNWEHHFHFFTFTTEIQLPPPEVQP
ncbi:MAG: hypothetical protein HKP53_09380 [Eudoraea sp.]|nr:hypothetical protein [Eudoraea sp.]